MRQLLAEDGGDGGKASQYVALSSPVDDLLIEVSVFFFLRLSVGELDQFWAVDDIDSPSNTSFPKVCPHSSCQRAAIGIHQVGFSYQKRVTPEGRPHAADHRYVAIVCLLQQGAFGIQRVDGIDDEVYVAFQDLAERLLLHEKGKRLQFAVGVDRLHPLCGHLGLQPAQTIVGCKNLSIEVGDAYSVEIDDSNSTDSAAYQGLEAHASHSPQSHQNDMFLMQGMDGIFTEKSGYA